MSNSRLHESNVAHSPEFTRLTRLETEVDQLKNLMSQVLDEVRGMTKTPWTVILSFFGAFILAAGLILSPYAMSMKALEVRQIELMVREARDNERIRALEKIHGWSTGNGPPQNLEEHHGR